MPFRIGSPLADLVVEKPIYIELGDSAAGYEWDIPPGSILPPGLHLYKNTGILYGAPTTPGQYAFYVRERNLVTNISSQVEFIVEVKNPSSAVDQTLVQQLIFQAFSFGRISPEQKIWFEKGVDAEGRTVLSAKADDNGQERTIAAITV